jgi:phospholipid transport system transporter-binding protein
VSDFRLDPASDERLEASGELTFETAAEALRRGLELIGAGRRWVVNLSRVEAGDSAGIAVLVEWLAAARSRGGAVQYEGVPEQMLAIARISDLQDLLLGR